MANIRVTPETLDDQGTALGGYADELAGVLRSIDAKITEINEGWDGLAQNAYLDMYSVMKEGLDQFPELVRALGQATKAAAEAFSAVDEQLQSSFQSANG